MKISIKIWMGILLGGAAVSATCSVISLVILLLNNIPFPNVIGLPLVFLTLTGYFALGFWASKKYPPSFVKEKNTSP